MGEYVHTGTIRMPVQIVYLFMQGDIVNTYAATCVLMPTQNDNNNNNNNNSNWHGFLAFFSQWLSQFPALLCVCVLPTLLA